MHLIAYLIFAQIIILVYPSIAIVILNFNGKKHLENFLPSVLASTYANKKVVMADNASVDDSVEFVKNEFPTVEIIVNHQNEGFAGGYNWALSNVVADYYVLLNSDVSVTPGWIEPIIQLMESDPKIGACQPKLLSYYNPHLFEYAGAAGGWIDSLGYPFSRGRVFDVCEPDNSQYNTTQRIFWASGAAMFVKSSVYHEMGGLDAGFFAHQEEIELCWRMQLKGYSIMACPASVVYHVGAGTLPRGGRKVFLNFRNNLIMLWMHLPLSEKLWKLPVRFALDAISAWKGLLTGDTYFFTAIMKAHFALFIWILKPNKNKKLSPKPLAQLDGVYKGSLVWQYFVLKKTSFQKIVGK